MRHKKFTFLFLAIVFIGFCLYQYIYFRDSRLHVVFCDVGQGDSIFLRLPSGADILIDGGPNDKVITCLENNMPFWDRTIDVVFLTHEHEDHIKGLFEVFQRYRVDEFITQTDVTDSDIYQSLLREIMSERSLRPTHVYKGSHIEFSDGVEIRVLWPPKGKRSNDGDPNSSAIALYIHYKNFDMVLPSDLDAEEVNSFSHFIESDIEVLKIAHQGSRFGTNAETFRYFDIKSAVISVGKNTYGHPHPDVLGYLDNNKIRYFRTDTDGEIEVITDGERHFIDN